MSHKNRWTLSVEGNQGIEIWVEPWGDLFTLDAETPIEVEIESVNEEDNARLDFNPTEHRVTIWFQDSAGRIRFLSDGKVKKEWAAGKLSE